MSLTTDAAILKTIGSAVKQRQPIVVNSTQEKGIEVKPLGLWARFSHWNNKEYHEARISNIASVVAKVIAVQPRLSLQDAANDESLKSARNILKVLKMQNQGAHGLQVLKREITAAKLGISGNTLELNSGLQQFTEKYHLERYLLGYNHNLTVNPETQEVSLLKEGTFQSWRSINAEVQAWPKAMRSPTWTWAYGPNGIQNRDFYDWTELKPFMKGDPAEWNHEYVFEFCACYNPHSIKNGNHSWLRLKTPEGDIYSVGLYRPEKMGLIDNLKTPLRIKPGFLMNPDVSEFWDFPISTVDFAITKEQFLKIKETLEEDKKNENLVFQLFNNNCLLYSKKLAKIAGVDLPTDEHILNLIAPSSLKSRVNKLMGILPKCVQKVCLYVSTFFLNLLQVGLGACRIDKDLNAEQRKRAVPHLKSGWDLFDPSKVYLHHPTTLSSKTRPAVLAWRQEQISKLAVKDERVINLRLPPAYYVQT
jgi:hypothetical protein